MLCVAIKKSLLFILGLLIRVGRGFKQTLREHGGVERLEIVNFFPDTDKLYRHIQVVFNREHHPAACGSVKFREDDAVFALYF
jgi:hypothetical protein